MEQSRSIESSGEVRENDISICALAFRGSQPRERRTPAAPTWRRVLPVFDTRIVVQEGVHSRALDALSAAVNQAHLAQPDFECRVDVRVDDFEDFLRAKVVQIDRVLDRNLDRLLLPGIVLVVVARGIFSKHGSPSDPRQPKIGRPQGTARRPAQFGFAARCLDGLECRFTDGRSGPPLRLTPTAANSAPTPSQNGFQVLGER